MVKLLTKHEKERIAEAVAQAETRTSAEIAIVITHSSGLHADFVLLYGLIASLLTSLALFKSRIVTGFLPLSCIEAVIIAAMFFIPILRRICWWFIPHSALHKRSYHRALLEYYSVTHQQVARKPVLLLFISIAERSAHIVPSHEIQHKIPQTQWEDTLLSFTNSITSEDLTHACVRAVAQIGNILTPVFMPDGTTHTLSNDITEHAK